MALPFVRTIRALETDRDYAATAGIIIVVLLLTAWSIWFFGATITLTETGQIVHTQLDGTIWAEFPAEAARYLHREQQALLRFQDAATGQSPVTEQHGTVAAKVLSVHPQPNGPVQVILYTEPSRESIDVLQEGRVGQVDVEAERLSPARLFLQVSGQFVDTPEVTLNSRN